MINVILSGCCGKMGRVISALADENDNINIICGIDISAHLCSFPVHANCAEYTGPADVIIDFSHPSAFDNLCRYAEERKIPLVMCTTGLSSAQVNSLNVLSKKIPVFYSANMSVGVNLLIELVQKAAKTLYGTFDIEIVERHHNKKIDAPSGTALAIADAINEVIPTDAEYMYDRHSRRSPRHKNEIGIHAVRGGNIAGDHSVIFAGTDEIIEINHHAASKEIFAAGALRAAEFTAGKPAGLYTMRDLVKTF